ncbi:hypothetical protein CPR_0496 [Clostridium perfringens SM101]|uniref:Uncharacterized protein n=1 Tax=Clostridium perfringens (strain SM101 / Type A) TaxID=289380 RepID=Q0SVM6_CLOPS|nr:hypothetical protein CPR_0496 [Clostridium perfringens SM101]
MNNVADMNFKNFKFVSAIFFYFKVAYLIESKLIN